ncbi:MAG: hypothetical protein ABIT08_10750 [Bacteroidia bacterium]
MKKLNLLQLLAVVAVLFTGSVQSAKAQTNSNHVFHINTWYMVPNQDSVVHAERNAMLKEYFTKVTMKNEFVIHQSQMTHFFTDDSREFVTITEFAKFGDIEKSFDRDSELERQAWPDTQKRQQFMNKMNSFFTYHKDAIFNGLSGLTK